ncbi:ABC transporter permease [Bifidobacterium sp. ESL0775]|uniref:ABC transporter permease n=1 Tax=Bifidobacterium sp. ESL0775 TaxID=2983230 RepID=UPI0023F9B564|nr:ABC transporter permease [Bifidobacterium sp. ESL0775]WEV69908.1 ABC transporter permease [Bifidobacterium sp. ESL0775]
MRVGDIIRLAFQNLRRRKSRTILTVLGVIVGSCSILIMISLGQGMSAANEAMLREMGDLTLITVGSNADGNPMMGMSSSNDGGNSPKRLNKTALTVFRNIENVKAVTPMDVLNIPVNVTAGAGGRYKADQYSSLVIQGIDMTQLKAMSFDIVKGREPLRSGEVLAGKNTAYSFGDKFRSDEDSFRYAPDSGACQWNPETNRCETSDKPAFFDPLTVSYTASKAAEDEDGHGGGIGAGITRDGPSAPQAANVNNPGGTFKFNAVGTLKSNQTAGESTHNGFLMSLEDLQKMRKALDPSAPTPSDYSTVLVKVDDISKVAQVQKHIQSLGYQATSSEDMRKQMQKESNMVQLALGGIGAVAFLVAAIGIANTMVMSVTERTREIGIMKALGCRVRDIRLMFLTEAAALGLLGGVVGCLLSGLASLGINAVANSATSQMTMPGQEATNISIIPWWLYLSALVFCSIIGLIFGFGPANKAVRIPAFDAIKNQE